MATKTIDSDVLDVLRRSTVESNRVRLPEGQLDRKLYQRVNDVLTRLGGKWAGGRTMAHVFDRDPAPLLAGVLGSGEKPRRNPDAFFPTPPEIVALMIDRGGFSNEASAPVLHVLEPSAGEGAIADAVLERCVNAVVHCVEVDPIRADALDRKGFAVERTDFLSLVPSVRKGPVDRVLMNPPFAVEGNATAYVDHIRHAWNFLSPGGRLVAICPSGFTFSANNRKLAGFLEWVDKHGVWEDLGDRPFRESGTDIKAVMIVLDKPGDPARRPTAQRALSDAWEPPTEDEAAALRHHESLVDPSA